MSAFMVNHSHIDNLVNQIRPVLSYYHKGEFKQLRDMDEAGRILLMENRRSVNHRYGETEGIDSYTFVQPSRRRTPVEIIKACDCFSYQACETSDWEESEAHSVIEAIRENAIRKLAGYEDADWEITDAGREERSKRKIISIMDMVDKNKRS